MKGWPTQSHLKFGGAIVLIWAGQAGAFENYVGPLGGRTTFYGQFSPSVISVDDGV